MPISGQEIRTAGQRRAFSGIRITGCAGRFGADRIGRDRAAQDVPEVLEGQGSRPGEHRRRVQPGSADTGAANTGMITARLATETTAREGQEAELWADLRTMHIFNPATGANITLDDDADGTVRGGTTAGAAAGTAADAPRDATGPAAPASPAASDAPAGPGMGAT